MVRSLDARQKDRYSRQLMMDWFKTADQRTLLSSRVLVVGAGGLGSAAIQYLTAAGVGTIGIVDGGTVKRSNLQRQVIHGVDDIGDTKVDSASRFVQGLNPDVEVDGYTKDLMPEDAQSLVSEYDVVVDGLDNFPSRFLVNDVAQIASVPFVHGAVYGYEGQQIVFRPDGPCYRCLLPEAPDPTVAPSGGPIGVFPPTPGIIGCLQATETLKLLLDAEPILDDRVLRYDAMTVSFEWMPLERNPECPVCGPDGIHAIDPDNYHGRCRIS